MKSINVLIKKICFVIYLLLALAPSVRSDVVNDADSVYQVGESRYMKIIVPRRGFLGAPLNPTSYRDMHLPKKDEDFRVRYGKITIIDKRELHPGLRVILRFDEVNEKQSVLHEGLFFYSINVFEDKGYIWTQSDDKNQKGTSHTGTRHGFPSPFTCSLTPSLVMEGKDFRGYYTYGNGAIFSQTVDRENPDVINVTVHHIQRKREKVVILSNEYIELDRNDWERAQKNSDAEINFTETQTWKKGDWLWDSMERVHPKGYVLMKCERMDGE